MTDHQMPLRQGIDPILDNLIPDWKTHTVDFLLKKYWETREYGIEIKNKYYISYEPQVTTDENCLIFNLCSANNRRSYQLQLAIALIKSCRGEYDSLPGIDANDEEFDTHHSQIISERQALEAYALLQKLEKN